ncbi:FAD/NAD(P)-binding protein [Nocardia asiatica]|uniref:FAD/NAD(P)-binding protein n=1 Tax=Nocardia asiatica TaxID=209252 RepID=UPI003EE22B6A
MPIGHSVVTAADTWTEAADGIRANGSRPPAAAVAIVGGGPRGISVLERLLLRAEEGPPLRIDVYDRVSPGSGRVWAPGQSPHLLMNTPAQEVTIFSGPPDAGPARAGAGPSLAEWSEAAGPPEYSGYETRGQYGLYLRSALRAMVDNAPESVSVDLITDTVLEVHALGGAFVVRTESGHTGRYESVVLATGHPQYDAPSSVCPVGGTRGRIIPGDSAADLPLDTISESERVAAIGMGLAFHDVVALLTQARGGRFTESVSGELIYLASGKEPMIVGVSRSGLPILARGRNEKPPDYSFSPRLCTVQRMRRLRRSGQLDFYRDVYPWILAEITSVFCHAEISATDPVSAERFLENVADLGSARAPHEAVRALGREYGVVRELPSLQSMARPFSGRRYASQQAWTTDVASHLRADLEEARQGNVSNPIKAALDSLRDLRPSIRAAVNYSGLTPVSHEKDFLGRFTPVYSLLAAGPPARRNEELLALLRAGIVRIAAPLARVVEDADGRRRVVSPAVPEAIEVDTVIETRIPQYDAGACRSALHRQLLSDGLIRRFRHVGAAVTVETGACETDPDTAEAIGRDGKAVAGLFVIGIPTERLRWFTQIGNGRPGVVSEFSADADRIAANCLDKLRHKVRGAGK